MQPSGTWMLKASGDVEIYAYRKGARNKCNQAQLHHENSDGFHNVSKCKSPPGVFGTGADRPIEVLITISAES